MTDPILIDIGGTNIRFARIEDNRPAHITKFKTAQFPGFAEAIAAYAPDWSSRELLIASAGYIDDNQDMRFVNNEHWVIPRKALQNAPVILNDFEAASWALLNPPEGFATPLKHAQTPHTNLCLIGPGTGLGLGYIINKRAQMTHGAHMIAAAQNDGQSLVLNKIRNFLGRAPSYEDLVSGRGIVNLYRAHSSITLTAPQDFLAHANTAEGKATLRLFHEFLGQCATTATICGHSYGGVYLTGGVIQHLREAQLLDTATIVHNFCLQSVASVTRDLSQTPIFIVNDETPAFQGLITYRKITS